VTGLRRELLGLGPRSSRFDVLGSPIVHLMLFKLCGMGGFASGHVVGIIGLKTTDKKSTTVSVIRGVHREPAFLSVGVDSDFHFLLLLRRRRPNHKVQSSIQIVQIGLIGATASSGFVGGSSAAAHDGGVLFDSIEFF